MRLPAVSMRPILGAAVFAAGRLGAPGWSGVGASILAAAVALIIGPSIERSNLEEVHSLSSLTHSLEQLRDPKIGRASRSTLDGFVDSLPPMSAVPDFVASLQRRADEGAVQIDRIEYHMQPELGDAVRRYRLSFPAHVDYPHLRPWLEALMHDYPNLALDELSLRREVDGGEELDAHLTLSFLVREVK